MTLGGVVMSISAVVTKEINVFGLGHSVEVLCAGYYLKRC